MSLETVRQLRQVKRLRADRAEQALRRARAGLAQAEAAVGEAKRVLGEWIAEMPRRAAAIYDAAIGDAAAGQTLDREGLEGLKRKVIALSEHRLVLERRVQEAVAAARQAQDGVTAAEAEALKARRVLGKFDELVEVLRRAEFLEAERREDAEMEEASENAGQREEEDADDLDRAA
jgi:hypothetical protein